MFSSLFKNKGHEEDEDNAGAIDPAIFTPEGWALQVEKAKARANRYRCMAPTKDGKLAPFPMRGENCSRLVYYGCSVATSLYLKVLKVLGWTFVVLFLCALPAMKTNYSRNQLRSDCREASRARRCPAPNRNGLNRPLLWRTNV